MADQRVYTLQSGFVTYNTGTLDRPNEEDPSFRDALYQTAFSTKDTQNYYDTVVEGLFRKFRETNSLMQKFEFRQEVLRAAYHVFGSNSLAPWIRLQLSHGQVGYLHRKFISECIGTAACDVPKTLDNYQYYRLLSPSQENVSTAKDERDIERYLRELVEQNQGKGLHIPSLLVGWTDDMNGFIDLLISMHVIFGQRHGVATVAVRAQT